MSSKTKSARVVDGDHYPFECSRCNAPLADVWVNSVNDMRWNMVAECCHCGDKSYQKTVVGAFIIGQTEEGQQYTVIDSFTLDTDPIVIKTKQVKPFLNK